MEVQQQLIVQILRWVGSLESAEEWTDRAVQVRPAREDVPFVLQERSARGVGGAAGLLPPEVAEVVIALQRTMFAPGTGTWITGMFTVTADGKGDARFNYDEQPRDPETGGPAMGPEDVRDHLQQFPRDLDKTPEWMRAA
ncbi:hypothetical protein [Nocardioides sp. CFH 31398]|uniref:hypothetical protein n=1 Tax=Nocardioides sp. CFH 31398 TaxID=2919579 RepID=UPI001F0559C1|nr:hypothetical protein [Nocardioides sp. CFH 31398]MCH1865808.1 hypothetical protein [Nocardioides sp. CFH 31398]